MIHKFIWPMRRTVTFLIIFFALALGNVTNAYTTGQEQKFFIEPSYDSQNRSELNSVLVYMNSQLYIYADKTWWNSISQSETLSSIASIANEFSSKIYPSITSAFGSEWTPGIDKDARITVLMHPMREDASGYFRSSDEYSKLQTSLSNEREMFYISSSSINNPSVNSFFAHEFMHLVTFNQKDVKNGKTEDTWLDEARSEYMPTLLGYDQVYSGSYLESRVKIFSESPTGSIVNWQDTKYDYARVNLFVHYLVDQYGLNVLSDSLKSSYSGIDSINYALSKNGFQADFSQVFSDWTIAVLVNDCDYGARYCYTSENLKNINVSSQINYLPVSGESTLTFADEVEKWSVKWYKIIGGGGGLVKFNFVGIYKVPFKVYYITKNRVGAYKVGTMALNDSQKGGVQLSNFGNDIISLYIICHLENNKITSNNPYDFSWSASVSRSVASTGDQSAEIARLQAIIVSLKQQIAELISKQNGGSSDSEICGQININLYFGMANNSEVRCLQEFLKNQGADIYPEGYTTGNFGALTKAAVIKFQAKYSIAQTGYVGPITRAKINGILSGQ